MEVGLVVKVHVASLGLTPLVPTTGLAVVPPVFFTEMVIWFDPSWPMLQPVQVADSWLKDGVPPVGQLTVVTWRVAGVAVEVTVPFEPPVIAE